MEYKDDLSAKTEHISIGIGEERTLSGWAEKLVFMLTSMFIAFVFYTAIFGTLTSLLQRSIFMSFVLPVAFSLYAVTKKRDRTAGKIPIYDLVLAFLGIFASLYIAVNFERLTENPFAAEPLDIPLAAVMLVLILETARRTTGIIFPIMIGFLIVYALIGPYLPGMWSHRGIPITQILEQLYLSGAGLWGPLMGIAVTLLPMFIIFGSVLVVTGASDTLLEIAILVTGRFTGGAGKISVISSALFGTVSGSAVANVIVDGVFTIPTMKRLGYPAHLAGAIESANSTGGQVMPPVMGSAAFVMAELLHMPYVSIAIAAAIPAVLYYWGCYTVIHFEARRHNLAAIPREEIPPVRSVLAFRKLANLGVPMVVLIYFLVTGWTPDKAAFYAVASSLILYFIPTKWGKYDLKTRLRNLQGMMLSTGRGILSTGILCACIQIIVALLGMGGLAVKFSAFLLSVSKFGPLFLLVLTGVLSTLLGMAAPTTAAYVLTAAICAPPLVNYGIPPFVAHMFCFYFATFSAITPPVAGASIVAAAIAQVDFWKVGWAAMRIAIVAYLIPFAFVFSPSLLLIGTPTEIVYHTLAAAIGCVSWGAAVVGFMRMRLTIFERLILAATGFMLFSTSTTAMVIGACFTGAVYLKQRYYRKTLTFYDQH